MQISVRVKTWSWLLQLILLTGIQSYQVYAKGDSLTFPGNWDTYPSHHEYLDFMHDLADSFPDICCLDTLGRSVGGRPILAIKITDNPNVREAEPAFYFTSTMHGDETSGYLILLRLADHICRNYGHDSLCTRLIDNVEIWLNPLSNPDGTYGLNDSIIYFVAKFKLHQSCEVRV